MRFRGICLVEQFEQKIRLLIEGSGSFFGRGFHFFAIADLKK